MKLNCSDDESSFIGGWARLSDEQIDLSADLVITSAIKNFHK